MENINWDDFFSKKFSIKVNNEYEHRLLIKNIPMKFNCYNRDDNYKHRYEKGWYIGRRSFGCCDLIFYDINFEDMKSRSIENFMTEDELKENKVFKEKLIKKLEEERIKYKEEQRQYWEQIQKNREEEEKKNEKVNWISCCETPVDMTERRKRTNEDIEKYNGEKAFYELHHGRGTWGYSDANKEYMGWD